MYKVKCYTPSAKEDRTRLSQFIHLDIINDEYVIAVVNQSELTDLQNKVNLEIEILSAFETDTVKFINENFDMKLLAHHQDSQELSFTQEYYLSSKSKLEIDLNNIVKERIPNEKREYDFRLANKPIFSNNWNYNSSNNKWNSLGQGTKSGQQDQIYFETTSVINPIIKITIIINYL